MPTDAERLDAAANWIRANKDKQGTPEWEKVTTAYKQFRAAPPPKSEAPAWQAGSKRTPFTAPNVTGNRTADIALEPVTGYAGRLNEAFRSADAMAEHGAKTLAKGDIAGLAGFIPGVAGVAAAPISAALEPIARPINEYISPLLQRTFGTPPEIATPVLTSLVPGLGITKIPTPKAPPSIPAPVRPNVKLREVPTNQEIRSQAGRAFKEADDAGVVYSGNAVKQLRENVLADLEEVGFDADLHPRVNAVLKRLDVRSDANPDGNLTLKGSEILRRVAMNAAKSPEKQERMLAWKVIDRIGEFQRTDNPGDVLMGDAKRGAQALANARELWARMSASEIVDLAIETASRRASKTGSGANIDNTIRQNVDKILGRDGKPRGFTKDEIAVMQEIVDGTPLRNALRLFGKASPTGVVSGGFGLGAVATAGPAGLMVPIMGFLSKIGADSLTKSAARDLSARIRSGDRTGGRAPEAPKRSRFANPRALPYYENRQR